jgi:tetratricopeptide (TPR) repeat protein
MPDIKIIDLLQRGIALHSAKDLEGARKCYRKVLEREPNHADALNLLGTIEGQSRRYAHAVKLIEAAIRLRPREPIYRHNLGHALLMANEPHLALRQLEEAVRLNPTFVQALCSLGKALEACGRTEEAIANLRKAAELDPSNQLVHVSLVESERQTGDTKHAIANLRRLLVTDPNDLHAIIGILTSERVCEHTPEVVAAENLLKSDSLQKPQRSALMHALGKAYDDLGHHDDAFRLVLEAKQLDGFTHDISKTTEWVRQTKAAFTREFFTERKKFGNASELPVFIVGMPRSGTTLTEQIVASHPKAVGAGELPHIRRISSIIGAISAAQEVNANALHALTAQKVRELADVYLERLSHGTSNKERITDKQPLNLRHLGTIALLFPNAKIIHCRRNPLDTCVSIFMQRFNKGHHYSYDLKTLGQFYRQCDELMNYWKDTVPLEILEIDYESTVKDLETQARRIISFLGLEWSDTCLNFQDTKRAVATASQWQVRQPLYKTSVARWQHYKKHLAPLLEGLETPKQTL